MTNIQIIAVLFGIIMAYRTFLHYKRKDFNTYQFFVWQALWAGFIIVIMMPNRFDRILQELGIIRAFDLFAIMAFVVILFLTYHNYLLITRLEKRLHRSVRDEALAPIKQATQQEKN